MSWRGTVVATGVALVLAGGLALALHRAGSLPDGPEPISWDREACAHCHMLIGEPAFAAQVIDEDGRVFAFDDPGCLLAFSSTRAMRSHAVWFHEVGADRWLRAETTGFVEVAQSPMGYRLGAVPANTTGALTRAEATARVQAMIGANR